MTTLHHKTARPALHTVFADLLLLGVRLKQGEALGPLDRLRTNLEGMFREASRRGMEQGMTLDELEAARYAVAAFLDEMIMNSSWVHRDEWAARPLQYQLFGVSVAGEEFFRRLDVLRCAVPPNLDVLEVYHLCLVLGFEGQYRVHGKEKLRALIEDLFWEIQGRQERMPTLSPYPVRPDEQIAPAKPKSSSWIKVASMAVLLFCIGYTGGFFFIKWEAEAVGSQLTQSTQEGRR